MIIRDGKLVLEVQRDFKELMNQLEKETLRKFGAIYKGQKLIWRTIYNAIKSCYGSGRWLGDKLWLGTQDTWKNN